MTAEPSQFLNEMPLDLIEDMSRGSSWLSFARSSAVKDNKKTASALRGENIPEKPKTTYTGKTYDNADAIAEFFKKKKSGQEAANENRASVFNQPPKQTGYDKLKALSSNQIKNPKTKNRSRFHRRSARSSRKIW